MNVSIYNKEGKKVGTESLPEAIFSVSINKNLIYQVYTAKLATSRINYAHTKTRAEVRGGGKKPWRQKGTGRARHGSTRSPIWVGGGITFGPRKDRVYAKKVNKKMNRKAISMILSDKLKSNSLFIIDSLAFENPKTKFAVALINNLNLFTQSNLVYGTKEDTHFSRIFRNIFKVKVFNISRINILNIMESKNCILSKAALNQLINNLYADIDTHIQKERQTTAAKRKVSTKAEKAKAR